MVPGSLIPMAAMSPQTAVYHRFMVPTEMSCTSSQGWQLEIVALLSNHERMSVAQVARAIRMSSGGTLHRLAQLESAGAIVHEEGSCGRGKYYYSLAPTSPDHQPQIRYPQARITSAPLNTQK
jgi:predicted ArsR family transcriptional regulator